MLFRLRKLSRSCCSQGCSIGSDETPAGFPSASSMPFRRSKETDRPFEIFMATFRAAVLFLRVMMLRSVESGREHILAASETDRFFPIKFPEELHKNS